MTQSSGTDYVSEFKAAVPQVIAKAWSDPSFESLLLANASQAFQQFGVKLPDSFDLRVVKNDAAGSGGWVLTESGGRTVMTLPLPPQGSSSGGAQAAGDCSSSSICCTG